LPRETLRLRTGDCDDLAVLYAALLENVGIDTALVDVGDHVLTMFDTGLLARQRRTAGADPGLLARRRARAGLGPGRDHARRPDLHRGLESAAATLASRRHTRGRMKEAWKKYQPLRPRAAAPDIAAPAADAVWALFAETSAARRRR